MGFEGSKDNNRPLGVFGVACVDTVSVPTSAISSSTKIHFFSGFFG